MRPMRRVLYPIFLLLLGFWLGATLMVDFVIVPSVFRIINDFFNAGELGITLFSKFNLVEMVISTTLVTITAYLLSRGVALHAPLLLAVLAWIIVMVYVFYLTPKLSHLTELFYQSELTGEMAQGGYPDIQQAHQYFHRVYIILDSIKILLLALLATLTTLKGRLWS
jgi:hypothetical protein